MIPLSALLLYKRSLARLVSYSDGKLVVEVEGGEQKKLREKDVLLLHPGPANKIPAHQPQGDFETAHAMLIGDQEGSGTPLEWKEFSELVFGDYSVETAAACALEALEGRRFALGDKGPFPLGCAEIERSRKKEEERLNAETRRRAFIETLVSAIRNKSERTVSRSQENSSFIAELESFALGKQERCTLAAEAGIAETQEAVHKALVDSGLWEPYYNPWPARAKALLHPPRLAFPTTELAQGRLPRKNLCHLRSLAIDNAWSKDPDDAIGFDNGTIWVHVADPAAFFGPNSDLDEEALNRGATLYLPERTIPMLPPEAVEIAALGLSEESTALSFGIKISEQGTIEETTIVPSLVRVTRMNYAEADELLKTGDALLVALDELAQQRHARRCANGAVDIDLPETSIRITENIPAFFPIAPARSSEIVREMMLLAGEAAARWARERSIPFVYSSQEPPQLSATTKLCNEGTAVLSEQYLRRKGMRASITGTEALAHRGLGLSFYSQVTSPLRRYQDLLAHYQIRAWLAGQCTAGELPGEPVYTFLSSNEVSRRCIVAAQGASCTRQAERDSRLHWICRHFQVNPGSIVRAVVLETRERDAWVLIPELGYECSIPNRPALELDQWVNLKALAAYPATLTISFERAD